MIIYCCTLTLHDNVFFATREMGLLYETEKYLHNWALSYAFFSVTHIPRPYRLHGVAAQKPAYLDRDREQNLLTLNNAGIYVFPAKPLHWSYQVNTFKAAQTTYYGRSKQFGGKGAELNYPINYGRAKELAVGSTYRTYILTNIALDKLEIPRWIRLGKWAAKIKVKVKPVEEMKARSGLYLCQHPLNPLDLPPSSQLRLYNRIVMPPVSLVSEAQLEGDYWEFDLKKEEESNNTNKKKEDKRKINVYLPRGMAYGAGEVAHVS